MSRGVCRKLVAPKKRLSGLWPAILLITMNLRTRPWNRSAWPSPNGIHFTRSADYQKMADVVFGLQEFGIQITLRTVDHKRPNLSKLANIWTIWKSHLTVTILIWWSVSHLESRPAWRLPRKWKCLAWQSMWRYPTSTLGSGFADLLAAFRGSPQFRLECLIIFLIIWFRTSVDGGAAAFRAAPTDVVEIDVEDAAQGNANHHVGHEARNRQWMPNFIQTTIS